MGAPIAERARFSSAPRHSIQLRFASRNMSGSKHGTNSLPSTPQPAGAPPAGLLFGNAPSSRPRDILSPRIVLRRTSSRDSTDPNTFSLPPLDMHHGEQYTGSPMPISRAATPLWETEALAAPYSPTRRSHSVRSVSSSARAPSPPPLAIRQPRAAEHAYEPPAPLRIQTQSMRHSALSNSRRQRVPSVGSQSSWTAASDYQAAPPPDVGHAAASRASGRYSSQDGSGRVRTTSASYRHEAEAAASAYRTSSSSTERRADTWFSRRAHSGNRARAQDVVGSPASWNAPLTNAQWSPATERSTASAPSSYLRPPSAPPPDGGLKGWKHWYHELKPAEQYKSAQAVMARREASEPRLVPVASLDTSVKTMREELEEREARDMRMRALKKQRELEGGL